MDWAVILVYIAILLGVSLLVSASPFAAGYRRLFANPNSAEATAFVLLVLPVLLYFAAFESSSWRATPGKRRVRLRVQHVGARLTFARAFTRSVLKLVPWELAHAAIWRIPGVFSAASPSQLPLAVEAALVLVYVIGALYALTVLVTPQGQTLYDLVTGTVVSYDQRSAGNP